MERKQPAIFIVSLLRVDLSNSTISAFSDRAVFLKRSRRRTGIRTERTDPRDGPPGGSAQCRAIRDFVLSVPPLPEFREGRDRRLARVPRREFATIRRLRFSALRPASFPMRIRAQGL